MVSEMAMSDLERLAADGVRVTWRDAVRLNAFGVQVERRSEIDAVAELPRIAKVDNLVLREPTIAAEIWLAKASRHFDFTDDDTLLQIRCFACAAAAGELPDPDDEAAVRAAVSAFAAARLAPLTRRRLWAALLYIALGDDAADGERTAAAPDGGKADEARVKYDGCISVGVVHMAQILHLGTVADLRRMTRRELESVVAYAEAVKFGNQITKSQRGERLARYFAVLDEIEKRAKKEAGDGGRDD